MKFVRLRSVVRLDLYHRLKSVPMPGNGECVGHLRGCVDFGWRGFVTLAFYGDYMVEYS